MPRRFDNIDLKLLPICNKPLKPLTVPIFAWGILICEAGKKLPKKSTLGRAAMAIAYACWLECKNFPRKNYKSLLFFPARR